MASDPQTPDYLTTREVAALLRVKERKVYELASTGEIPCRRVTGKLLFPRADIQSWLGSPSPAASCESYETVPRRPDVMAGSHDPLLDWALRESACGMAMFFDGSLDGLDRMLSGDALAAGMHVFEPEVGDWNVSHVATAAGNRRFALMEFAKREQGLLLAPGIAGDVTSVADLKGKRVIQRQPKAGGRLLFDHLLSQSGLKPDDLELLPNPARTESDAAAAISSGQGDASIGLKSMATQYRLDFLPLTEERYDLLVCRRSYFEPPMQTLLAFCRTSGFRKKAEEMSGYDVSGFGQIHWNA